MCTDCLLDMLDLITKSGTDDRCQFFFNLSYILETLKEIFHAEGEGLDKKQLDTVKYKVP